MMKISAIVFAFTLLAKAYAAPSLVEYLDTKDTYLVAYFNVDSISDSNIYSSMKANFPISLKNNDIVNTFYPQAAEKGITEKDISEAVLSVDATVNKPLMKETINYLIAIKIKKNLSKQDMVNILTYNPSGSAAYTTKQITVGLMKAIEITSNGNSMFVYMPDSKTIFASDDLPLLSNLTSRYKGKTAQSLPERLIEQKKLIGSDAAFWIIAAVPPAVRYWLEDEEGKIPANNQPQDIVSMVRIIIKGLIGMSVTVKAGDSFDVKSVAIFTNSNAANILHALVNQYMPLLKLQVFMMSKANTEVPFLNTIINKIDGNNCILTFSLSKEDMKGVMNLSIENQKIGNRGN